MEPRRSLGLTSATALVVASMIGAGVFTTSGFVLADLGSRPLTLLAWLVSGCVALSGAACYAAIGTRFPESGGEYAFLRHTVGPGAGFLAGWVSLLAGFTAPIALAAQGLEAYLLPALGFEGGRKWLGTGAILVAALLHGARAQQGVVVQNAVVGLKLLLLAGFLAMGAWTLPSRALPAAPAGAEVSAAAFAASLVWIYLSYSGWNAAVYVGGEVREPQRELRRSLLIGTTAVTVLYLGLNAVFLYAAPFDELAGTEEVAAVAARSLGGPWLEQAVRVLVGLALFTSVSSMVMSGPRVYARMAEDGCFPRFLAWSGTAPTAAVALQAGLAVAVLWISELAELLRYVGFTLGLSAAATVAGFLAWRRRTGTRAPIPGDPFVPLFFVAAVLGASFFLALREPREALWGALTVVSGAPLYLFWRSRAEAEPR